MPRDRVVVVGAGIAGLVSAFALAARGLEVTLLERGAAPGGKMRQVAHRPFTDRQRPDRLHHALGVRRVVRIGAGRNFADHVRLRPLDTLARHAWDENTRLDLFADEGRSVDAIGDFAGAAEAARYRTFCRDSQADLRHPRKAVPPRAAAEHGRADRRRRFPRTDAAAADQAVLLDVVGAGAIFPRSPAAPVVRALRDLLRLLAVQGAGDVDAGRACRARRRVDHRRRHAWAGARARRIGRGAGRGDPLQRGSRRGSHIGRSRLRRQACER